MKWISYTFLAVSVVLSCALMPAAALADTFNGTVILGKASYDKEADEVTVKGHKETMEFQGDPEKGENWGKGQWKGKGKDGQDRRGRRG